MASASKENTFTFTDKDGNERSVTIEVTSYANWDLYGADADGNRGQWQWEHDHDDYDIPDKCDDDMVISDEDKSKLESIVSDWSADQAWEYEDAEPI
jgi:hypothetical protein